MYRKIFLTPGEKFRVPISENDYSGRSFDESTIPQTLSNVVATLSAWSAELAGAAVAVALRALQDPALLRVTRHEYFTYLTREGELYDKSGVPGSVPHTVYYGCYVYRNGHHTRCGYEMISDYPLVSNNFGF